MRSLKMKMKMKVKDVGALSKEKKHFVPKAYLEHRLFVPKEFVTSTMKNEFVDVIEDYYDEEDENGDPREDRSLVVKGYKVGDEYVSFERGDLNKIRRIFKQSFNIRDRRASPKLSTPISFLGVKRKGEKVRSQLRPEQVKAFNQMVDEDMRHGILECPPRFGKTITGTAIICELGLRTLILVNQEDLARQFENRFRSATNVGALELKLGRKLIGYATKWNEIEKLDIAIVTWQKFHRNRKRLIANRNTFGLVLIDEVHRFASECSPSIVDNFNSKYRIGMTATPERKDQRDVIIKNIVGPVTVRGKTKQVPLLIKIVNTKFCPEFKRWNTYVSKIMKSKTRNKIILDNITSEVKKGKHCLVVATRVEHMEYFKTELNKRNISAAIFRGGLQNKKYRQQVIDDASSGKIKVTVANRQLLTGIDVPVWDSLHVTVPSANPPNYYQEFSRIRTPLPTKQSATVFDYVDAHSASNGCYRKRHSLYINKAYGPISFLDDNGNPLAKAPSCQSVINKANDPTGTPIYGDGAKSLFDNNNDPDATKNKPKQTGWMKWNKQRRF